MHIGHKMLVETMRVILGKYAGNAEILFTETIT